MRSVAIVLGHGLAARSTPAWAAEHLAKTLRAAGTSADVLSRNFEQGLPAEVLKVRGELSDGSLSRLVTAAGLSLPAGPEAFALVAGDGTDEVVVVGSDDRGLSYGLLELADRVRYGTASAFLGPTAAESFRPATQVRGILRAFVSEVQDKPWFYSRDFWSEYLTELATHRVNRFQLAFGMQHNYSHDSNLQDYYFCFSYPYLVNVSGFSVVAEGLAESERQRNLEALRYASDEAARRGIQFQLGLWNHAYDPGDSPQLRYPIRGLDAHNHADYCRAALAELLRSCPSITGLTLRVHYEAGIPELGQETFWGKVLSALEEIGRPIELDMHAKGVSEDLINIGTAAGSPLILSAKYWAEHQGLPYHQSAIRETEKARPADGTGIDAKTHFTRRFTRYGYGDFLREERPYGLIFRIWPGTQRILLWGDPVLASGYGRLGTFAGALGIELCEPLTFKGRMNSGSEGGRDPYAEESLQLGMADWKKYLYTYRLWGRLLYDPDADPSNWRRYVEGEYGAAAADVEEALSCASRILPLVTTTHGLGASNNGYWPEMYLNMPLAGGGHSEHYALDTAAPATFGSISSFDPEMFSSIDEYVDELLTEQPSGRYSPLDVAHWLEQLAESSEAHLAAAAARVVSTSAPAFRRMSVDVLAQIGLGRFFANKNRAGIAYALFKRTSDVDLLSECIKYYQVACNAFRSVALVTSGIYQRDLKFGNRPSEHGHWLDRLTLIEEDLAALKSEHEGVALRGSRNGGRLPIKQPVSRKIELEHCPAEYFVPGEQLILEASAPPGFSGQVAVKYRHVNQAESYESADFVPKGGRLIATIDGSYTRSPFALQYFFVLSDNKGGAWIQPGLDVFGEIRLANQPYFLIRQKSAVIGCREDN